ncbi:histidine kinase, partial [Streptomyces sp. WAC 06725]
MLGRIRQWQQHTWRQRSKAERVEMHSVLGWYTSVWVFSLVWLVLPVAGDLRHRPLPVVLVGLLLAANMLQCAVDNALTRPALDHYLGRRTLSASVLKAPLALLGLALVLLLVLTA